ncbi:MAG: immunoglobulin-like domain-containing protein [Pseudomonadales bacterium]
MKFKPLTIAIACALAGCQPQESTTTTSGSTASNGGAISSTVCQDFNMNGQCDGAESAISASGQSLSGAGGGQDFPMLMVKSDYVLMAPGSATFISPFTTLVEAERLFNPSVNKDLQGSINSLNTAFSATGIDFSPLLTRQGHTVYAAQIEQSLRSAQQLAPNARYAAVAASLDKMIEQQSFNVSVNLDDVQEYLHDTVVNVQYQNLAESTKATSFSSAAGITLASTGSKLVLLEGSNAKSFELSFSSQNGTTTTTNGSVTNTALNSTNYIAAAPANNWDQYRADDDDDDDDSESGASGVVTTPTIPTTPTSSSVKIDNIRNIKVSPNGAEAIVLSQNSTYGFNSNSALQCYSSTSTGDGIYRINLGGSRAKTNTNTTSQTQNSYTASNGNYSAWVADSISAASGGTPAPPTPTPTPTTPPPDPGQLGAIKHTCSNDDVAVFDEHWGKGILIASDVSGSYIQKVDLASLRPMAALAMPSGSNQVNTLRIDQEGNYALIGNDSGIWLINISSMQAVDYSGGLTPSAKQIDDLAFYDTGRAAVSWQKDSSTLERFDLVDDADNYQRPIALTSITLPSNIKAAVMLDEQKSIAIAGSDKKIYIIDLFTGAVTRTLPALSNEITAMSVDGDSILAMDASNKVARINFRNVVGSPLNVAVQNLTLDSILAGNPDSQQLTQDLNLVSTIPGIDGVAITWSSSDNSLIDVNGKVTRPAGSVNLPVTLTATLTRAYRSQLKTERKIFNVKVRSL